jgi:hypothetical protein
MMGRIRTAMALYYLVIGRSICGRVRTTKDQIKHTAVLILKQDMVSCQISSFESPPINLYDPSWVQKRCGMHRYPGSKSLFSAHIFYSLSNPHADIYARQYFAF